MGKNSIYEEDIKFAAARAGLSPPAVAALIDAEAAKINGVWDPNSKNPRSSALGITQFLRGTWLEQAEKKGTYLNDHAHASGYLDAAGKVKQQDQETVLDLRRNPRFAIVAATDYANANLTSLSRAGLLPQDMTDSERAKIMYLTHHLGPGDVRGFLTRQIPEERAKTLLTAQVGEPAADSRRAMDQSWVQAHRSWLTSFVESSVDIRKFTKDGVSTSQGRNVEEMSNR